MLKTESIKQIIDNISDISKAIKRPVKFMEVCGTHTQAIARYGI